MTADLLLQLSYMHLFIAFVLFLFSIHIGGFMAKLAAGIGVVSFAGLWVGATWKLLIFHGVLA